MMTFGNLFDLYLKLHVEVRTRCPKNARQFARSHGPRWHEIDAQSITRIDVQRWIDEVGLLSPSAANRAANTMSAVFSWGIKRGYVTEPNPCRGLDRFRMRSRERFILPEEMERFKASLEHEEQDMRDFFWLCLLTGARRGNIQAMRWDEVSVELESWTIPASKYKNGDAMTIPLSSAALAIIDRRSRSARSSWVFPGSGKTGHRVEPKRAWGRILKRANLADLCIHDLRRTFGSYLAIAGESLPVIGKALGHRDARSTQVYARLHLSPVRVAVEQLQSQLVGTKMEICHDRSSYRPSVRDAAAI